MEDYLYCKFCGSSILNTGKYDTGEMVCSCYAAKKYRWRKERIDRAKGNINDAILGDGVETVYGDEALNDTVADIMNAAAAAIIDGKVDSIAMKIGANTVKVMRGQDYQIYIKRSNKKETIVGE